jgi:hypothetical protein
MWHHNDTSFVMVVVVDCGVPFFLLFVQIGGIATLVIRKRMCGNLGWLSELVVETMAHNHHNFLPKNVTHFCPSFFF